MRPTTSIVPLSSASDLPLEPSRRAASSAAPFAWGVAAAAIVAVLAATDRLGGDMPGVLLRVEAFRKGDWVHLPQWFGGVANLTYSILLGPLGALLGVTLLAALSSGSTVAGVVHLSRSAPPLRRNLAAIAAVTAAVATVCVGRVTYSTGTGFAVWAVAAIAVATPRRTAVAAVFAMLAGASSPVAGFFLAMVAAGHLLPARRTSATILIVVAALAPVEIVNLMYAPDGGLDLGWRAGLAICALYAAFVFGSRSRSVRAVAGLGIAATIGVTVVDTQVTYIVKRLPETFGGATAAVTGRRLAYPVLVAALLAWNALSIRTGVSESGQGERSGAAFAPLVAVLTELDPARPVEVVPTALHWETWHVARRFPIARGWERQADAERGPAFYHDAPLTAEGYAEWLRVEDVGYVALGDLTIDHAGAAEARLLADPPSYLVEVARTDGWTVWRVDLP